MISHREHRSILHIGTGGEAPRGRAHLCLLGVVLVLLVAGCQGEVGAPCFTSAECEPGLECTPQNVCVRPGGSLVGEACGTEALVCSGDLWCEQLYPDVSPVDEYLCTEDVPIYPPTKELTTTSGTFTITSDTKIIIPPAALETDQTAAEVVQDAIGRFGFTAQIEPYAGEPVPDGSIVLGTPSSNPGVASLVAALSVDVPAEAPALDENYAVRVSPTHIVVAGNGALGTLHGAEVLKQIIRGLANTNKPPVLDAYYVRDWPDNEQRQAMLSLINYQDLFFPSTKDPAVHFDVDTLPGYAEVLSEWRMDTMLLEISDMVDWDSHDEPHPNAATKAEFLGALDSLRKYGLRFIIQLNGSSGHFGWISESYEATVEHNHEHHTEYLTTYLNMLDEILTDVDAVIPLEYINVGFDEDVARYTSESQEFVQSAYNLCVSHGIKMFMYQPWHVTTILYPELSRDWVHLSVFDYGYFDPIHFDVVEAVLNAEFETSLMINARTGIQDVTPEEWTAWYAFESPLQMGPAAFLKDIKKSNGEWRFFRNVCSWLRPYMDEFWNGRSFTLP